VIIIQEEAITIDNFDADDYASKLREQGYREDVIPDLVEKKKASLQKIEESNFEYIIKIEEVGQINDHIIVAGIASNGSLDWDDEIIDLDSLRSSWDDYMKNPVLRYMHGKDSRHPDAIGRVIPEYITESGKILKTEFRNGNPFIVAEISNAPDVEDIRIKIQEGVLRGFSIGGRANRVTDFCHKLGKNIDKVFVKRLSEISIVDLPANKKGFFEIIKGCVGNNCSYNIDNKNYEGINIPENDTNENIEIEKSEMENKMTENIEMEMTEQQFKEFIKSTVSEMIEEQETIEKIEAGEAAIKEAQDLRTMIDELEAKIIAMAEQLKSQPQETMKTENEVEEVIKDETIENDRVSKLESEIKEIKESPLYKSEQIVGKTETVEQVSHLANIIKAHYGGN
jgi:hypothetical protein